MIPGGVQRTMQRWPTADLAGRPGSGLGARCGASRQPFRPRLSFGRVPVAAAPLLRVRHGAEAKSAGAVPVLVVLHGLEAARRRVLRGGLPGQLEQLAPPGYAALDAVLLGRIGLGRIVETAKRDVDPVFRQVAEGKRGAAITAEAALGGRGALVDGGLASGPGDLIERDAGDRHEQVAYRLLAHPAVADVGRVRLGVEGVAHRVALAAAGQRRWSGCLGHILLSR